jgi:hypothetical protein
MGRTFERRRSIDLDGEWRLIPDPERILRADALPEGRPIAVPGCWEAQLPWGQRVVTAWYRRSLTVPAEWRGSRVAVRFGAVMYLATVYLDGHVVAEHEGGYTPFEADLSDVVRWGEPAELVVHVHNPMNAIRRYPAWSAELAEADRQSPDVPPTEIPHGKQSWYASQSGIWQSVRLEARARPALGGLWVVPDVAGSAATVRWRLDEPAPGTDEASRPRREAVDVRIEVRDPSGAVVAAQHVPANGSPSGEVSLPIREPQLWDIGRPNLYTVVADVLAEGDAIDRLEARFGMREIRTEGGRILLNGRPTYLIAALDQDLYAETISTPPSRAMLDEQIARARELGLNLLRCHIKVPDPAYLDAADEAGMLLWCELPNWMRFTAASARRGRETLASMVDALGNHPSIIAWTIINEDWGTRVREEPRDRAWLADTVDWLKAIDPTRLVIDNSACDTAATPNFHVKTDLADFHVYHGAPDNAVLWRNRIADFASDPPWLWSPHGDAQRRGDEPLVLSEFGTWGLPRLDRVVDRDGTVPWWFDTGRDHLLPLGIAERFGVQGLERVWPTIDELAEATQWHQFEALQYEIGQLRRHDAIQGYVITELSDAYWEANGLLDVHRGRKVFHDVLRRFNSRDVIVADLDRRDVWAGDRLTATVHLGAYGGPVRGGRVEWELRGEDGPIRSGMLPIADWPDGGAREVGLLVVEVPTELAGDARLALRAVDDAGETRAADEYRLAIVPRSVGTTLAPLRVAVDDPLGIWTIDDRLRALGHHVGSGDPDLVVASAASPELIAAVDRGASGLVLARSRSAIDRVGIARPIDVRARALPDPSHSDGRSAWDGDWVTAWSWLLPGALPGLPERNPLDFAYAEVIPDHVLAGYDPRAHRDEVIAGMFAGWVHAPAALIWSFPQGRGRLTATTFRVAPESGPVATALLEGLVGLAVRGATPSSPTAGGRRRVEASQA